MAKKKDVLRKIDQRTNSVDGGLPFIQEEEILSPAPRALPSPDTLTLIGTGIERATQAPLAYIAFSWSEAPNISPDFYSVEWSVNSNFADSSKQRAYQTDAYIGGLKVNTLYYIRVQAIIGGMSSDYSDVLQVTTSVDTTVPQQVSSLSATFVNGDLVIKWTNPIDEAFKDVEIKIYNGAHAILLDTFHTNAQQITWSADQNISASGGTATTSVSIDVISRSWNNVLSALVNTTATSSAPATPSSITSSWDSDTGTAAADVVISWLGNGIVESYDLSLDGVAYSTKDTRFTYRYDRNVADHVPTLKSGDSVLSYQLRSKNKLGQQSAIASGTLTNAAPSSSLLALSAVAGFNLIAAQVSLLSGAIIQDFDHYAWTLVSGAITVQQFISTTPDVTFQVSGSGTYSVKVRAVDKFNQNSADVIVSGLVVDALTIAQLRAETTYTDSKSSTQTTLNILKDGIGIIGSSVSYTPSASWQWIKADRPLLERYKVFTVSYSQAATGSLQVYFKLDDGNGNITYAAGPIFVSGTQQQLSFYTVEASAQLNAIDLSATSGDLRYDLTSIIEARSITMYFKVSTQNALFYEYYPRRLVQSDDIEAEAIKSINVAAGAITAGKISVVNLQAISANMGNLHIDSVLDIGSSGGIYQGTGSFASPTTGLKIFNSGGIGLIQTFNSGVLQVSMDTDGKFKAGAGNVVMDSGGFHITVTTAQNTQRDISFYTVGGTKISRLSAWSVGTLDRLDLASTSATNQVDVRVTSSSVNTLPAQTTIQALSGGTAVADIFVKATGSIGESIGQIDATNIYLNGAVEAIGYVTADQGIRTLGILDTQLTDAVTNVASTMLSLRHFSSGTPAAGFGGDIALNLQSTTAERNASLFRTVWATATDASRKARIQIFVFDTAAREALRLEASGTAPMIGFYGGSAVAKQTITGTRTGTLAQLQTVVANLLTALANTGLITDSTT